MNPSLIAKAAVVVVVVAAAAAVLRLKQAESSPPAVDPPVVLSRLAPDRQSTGETSETPTPADRSAATVPLPKLLDLGADKCIPCKKMAPILTVLREDFAGQFDVIFIDVWKDRQAAVPYRISIIPTQIFFDEEGTELFRHQGFFSRDDILSTWSDLGYVFADSPGSETG